MVDHLAIKSITNTPFFERILEQDGIRPIKLNTAHQEHLTAHPLLDKPPVFLSV